MVTCSAEQSDEQVGQLPHPDPSGGSFLQSWCHGEGGGSPLHRQPPIAKTKCIPRDTQSDLLEEERIPRDTLSREQKVYPRWGYKIFIETAT